MNAKQRRRRAHDLRAAMRRVQQIGITENTVITIHCASSGEAECVSQQAEQFLKKLSPPPKSIVITVGAGRFEVAK